MKIVTKKLEFSTQGRTDIINITEDVRRELAAVGLKEGMAFLFVIGSTAGITTIEFEGGLERDLKDFFDKIIPSDVSYAHDETWGDANGFSHLRASLLKPSLSVPFVKAALTLGTWQQIVLVDFDNRPRRRQLVLQLQGE